MDETFFRSPPHGLGNSPSTAGPNSSYFAKIFLRRVPCDFSEQTLVQVLCTFELLLDSATFWFLSRLLESLHVTRPTSVNRVARKRQHNPTSWLPLPGLPGVYMYVHCSMGTHFFQNGDSIFSEMGTEWGPSPAEKGFKKRIVAKQVYLLK